MKKRHSQRPFKESKTGETVLYGISPVESCLISGSRPCFKLMIREGGTNPRLKQIEKLARDKKIPIEKIATHNLATVADTKYHQGVALTCGDLKTTELGDFLEARANNLPGLIVALDQIEDPQNFGAIVRSAAFLGAAACLTLRRHAAPLSAAVSKASAGALENLPIIQAGNLSESLIQLGNAGYMIVGADSNEGSEPFLSLPKSDLTVLVLGNEGQGLRQLTRKRCDAIVNIPGSGVMESLNVSAAAAILIHHFSR